MKENDIWVVEPFEGSYSVKQILDFLLPEYCRMFDSKTMYAEKCIVYNDCAAECPMLVTNYDPIRLRLAQLPLNYWSQTLFQLSHEMCHYAIRQGKTDKTFTINWLEEIICEAASLYALNYAKNNWRKCSLSQLDNAYSRSIFAYLSSQLNHTIEQLEKYNSIAGDHREGHGRERNTLYSAILKKPGECKCFCEMYRYLNPDRLTINFEAWKNDSPSELIKCLERIQPCIKS